MKFSVQTEKTKFKDLPAGVWFKCADFFYVKTDLAGKGNCVLILGDHRDRNGMPCTLAQEVQVCEVSRVDFTLK